MPRYSKDFIGEIKSRLRVSDVIGKFVKLTQRGNEFVGLSPFKNEKTPSFTVNDEKEFFHFERRLLKRLKVLPPKQHQVQNPLRPQGYS